MNASKQNEWRKNAASSKSMYCLEEVVRFLGSVACGLYALLTPIALSILAALVVYNIWPGTVTWLFGVVVIFTGCLTGMIAARYGWRKSWTHLLP